MRILEYKRNIVMRVIVTLTDKDWPAVRLALNELRESAKDAEVRIGKPEFSTYSRGAAGIMAEWVFTCPDTRSGVWLRCRADTRLDMP